MILHPQARLSRETSPAARLPRAAVCSLLGMALLLGGCATRDPQDPLQPYNRAMFSINQNIDKVVLKPVATGYRNVTPEPVRRGVSNFFGNLGDVWSTGNDFLQGHLAQGFNGVMRVSVNTVFGVFGLVDIATPLGLYKQPNDFGLTLARWGLGGGPYIVLPLLGPSNVLDTVDTVVGATYGPSVYLFHDSGTRYGLFTLNVVNHRANLLSTTELLDQIAIDPYIFTRDAYLQRRRAEVRAVRHTGVLALEPADDSDEGGAGAGPLGNGGSDNGDAGGMGTGASAPAAASPPAVGATR